MNEPLLRSFVKAERSKNARRLDVAKQHKWRSRHRFPSTLFQRVDDEDLEF